MPDYKEMYLKIFRAAEQAASILIAAQQECEELYISSPEPLLQLINPSAEKSGSTDLE